MNLAGLTAVKPEDRELVQRAMNLLSDGFMEEMWFVT